MKPAKNRAKTPGHSSCSMPGRERPEYLRQGAVSCWGAGSPANTGGIVNNGDAPFFVYTRGLVTGAPVRPSRQTAAPSGYCNANRSSFASESTVVPDRFQAPSVSNRRSPIRRPQGAITRPIARKSVRSACS